MDSQTRKNKIEKINNLNYRIGHIETAIAAIEKGNLDLYQQGKKIDIEVSPEFRQEVKTYLQQELETAIEDLNKLVNFEK